MSSAGRWLPAAILVLAAGCATFDAGPGEDAVDPRIPMAVDGDPQALAWPVHVAPDDGLNGLRLRIEAGGTLVAVRPDSDNPEPSAPGWTGSHRNGEAVWKGPPPSRPIPLLIMVRAPGPGDQELRVRYALESAGGVSGWTCERWLYRISKGRIERARC
ncbi:MAG TPA: hypothetical protein VJP59_01925 [Gemmatimonadota bacterium]|nr:hypothetical protein [Gemmatimonadota bacterium]